MAILPTTPSKGNFLLVTHPEIAFCLPKSFENFFCEKKSSFGDLNERWTKRHVSLRGGWWTETECTGNFPSLSVPPPDGTEKIWTGFSWKQQSKCDTVSVIRKCCVSWVNRIPCLKCPREFQKGNFPVIDNIHQQKDQWTWCHFRRPMRSVHSFPQRLGRAYLVPGHVLSAWHHTH